MWPTCAWTQVWHLQQMLWISLRMVSCSIEFHASCKAWISFCIVLDPSFFYSSTKIIPEEDWGLWSRASTAWPPPPLSVVPWYIAKHRTSYRMSYSQILTSDMLTHCISTDVGRVVPWSDSCSCLCRSEVVLQVLQDNSSVVVILGLPDLGWSLTLPVTSKSLLNFEIFACQ